MRVCGHATPFVVEQVDQSSDRSSHLELPEEQAPVLGHGNNPLNVLHGRSDSDSPLLISSCVAVVTND